MGVGLSMEESPKDCVQRGALDAVVRRRPLMAAVLQELGQGCWGASTGVAAIAVADLLATDAVTEPATMY